MSMFCLTTACPTHAEIVCRDLSSAVVIKKPIRTARRCVAEDNTAHTRATGLHDAMKLNRCPFLKFDTISTFNAIISPGLFGINAQSPAFAAGGVQSSFCVVLKSKIIKAREIIFTKSDNQQ